MLNAVIALALAVTLVVAPPSAFAGPGVESTTVAEIVEDLDPESALVAAASPVPAKVARRFDDANAADPAIACALPPPVPPPERSP